MVLLMVTSTHDVSIRQRSRSSHSQKEGADFHRLGSNEMSERGDAGCFGRSGLQSENVWRPLALEERGASCRGIRQIDSTTW